MQTNFRGRDFIGDLDFSKEEVETVLDVAWDLKRKRALGEPHALLRDKTLAMLFFFTSTRTRGSFEAGVQVTRGLPTSDMLGASRELGFLCSDRAVLRVSGNPVKFLQGHNVAGPSVAKLGPVVQGMVRAFAEGLRPVDADDERLPAVHRSRVDVTTAVDLGSHQAVHDWLRLAATTTRSRHGPALDSSGTVYWGKNSTRWALKAYCKHCELRAHPVIDPGMAAELLEWTRSHLRIELTLRRQELRDRGSLDESIIWEYARKVEVPSMKMNARMDEVQLPTATKFVFQGWLDGHDVSKMCPRTTFWRYRRAILDAVGVDIKGPVADQMKADPNVLLSIEELEKREVVFVPRSIQRSLFGAAL